MISKDDFLTKETLAVASKSYATVREIFNVGKTAERKNGGQHLDISSFGKLFGLNIENGNTNVALPSKLTMIRDGDNDFIPVLFLYFDQTGTTDIKALVNGLVDALSVKVYTKEEFMDIDLNEIRSTPKQKHRPVLNYEGKVLRTEALNFAQKFKELKPTMDPEEVELISKMISEEGTAKFEDAIIDNLGHAFSERGILATHYNAEIIDAMETKMMLGGKFGDVASGVYACNDIYTDVIDKIYRAAKEKEQEEEREI